MGSILDSVKRVGRRIHGPLPDLSQVARGFDSGVMSEALGTLYRRDDLASLKSAMIQRYATVLETRTHADIGVVKQVQVPYTTRDAAMQDAILMGQFELARLYLFDSLVRQTATLFSVPTSRFAYSTDGLDATMADLRLSGHADMAAVRWDALSVACGSSALYLSVRRGVLWETEVPLTSLWWAFPAWVEVEGAGQDDANGADLDDAGVMVMQIEGGSDGDCRFLAWYGPTQEWPLGRHCSYTARQWYDIPKPGTKGCREFAFAGGADPGQMVDGDALEGLELANPLTLWAQRSNDWSLPTYPFAPLAYDPLSPGLFPTSTSIYQVCQEFDIASGLILGSAVRGARGQRILSRPQGGSIPANAEEGLTVLDREQTLTIGGWAASNSRDAMDVVDQMARHIAEAHSVPGWLVVADKGDVPSGYAVKLMTQPLQDMRGMRAALNRSYVARRFDIERALVNATLGSTAIPVDAVETWDAGQRDFPEEEVALMQAWQAKVDMGVADIADVACDLYQIDTREEAWAMLEAHKAEADAHPDLVKAPAPEPVAQPFGGGGIAAQIAARRAQRQQ